MGSVCADPTRAHVAQFVRSSPRRCCTTLGERTHHVVWALDLCPCRRRGAHALLRLERSFGPQALREAREHCQKGLLHRYLQTDGTAAAPRHSRGMHNRSNILCNSIEASDLAHRAEGLVEITCADTAAFRTNKDFRKIAKLLKLAAERVSSGRMTRAASSELETASGFRCNPHGIACCDPLEPYVASPEVINYDWVHSALQSGVVTCEIEAILASTGVPRADLQSFLANPELEYPGCRKQKAQYLHRVFDARQVGSDEPDKVKASCSELIGLYGMLRVFLHLQFAEVPASSDTWHRSARFARGST